VPICAENPDICASELPPEIRTFFIGGAWEMVAPQFSYLKI